MTTLSTITWRNFGEKRGVVYGLEPRNLTLNDKFRHTDLSSPNVTLVRTLAWYNVTEGAVRREVEVFSEEPVYE